MIKILGIQVPKEGNYNVLFAKTHLPRSSSFHSAAAIAPTQSVPSLAHEHINKHISMLADRERERELVPFAPVERLSRPGSATSLYSQHSASVSPVGATPRSSSPRLEPKAAGTAIAAGPVSINVPCVAEDEARLLLTLLARWAFTKIDRSPVLSR
jgi:hypothetical protein